jgi:hypothetical protein
MSDYTVPLEAIIYSSFVKMERMGDITYQTFSNSSIADATTVNVFIDVYSVLKSIFSEHYRTTVDDYTSITSGLINMCSHYRSFFKRLQVHSKFYLIFSFNTCDINEKFVAGYNQDFKKKSEIKLFRQIAMDNFKLLDLLCPYLPDVFFIKSIRNYESAVMIANLIEVINDGNPNLIISKDIYPLQLTALYKHTAYLFPIKKKDGNDESVMVPINEKYSYREEFWNLVALRRQVGVDKLVNINPINFAMISSMWKFPERGMTAITNISSARNIINMATNNQDIEVFPEMLYNNAEISSSVPVSLIESRYKTLDVRYMLPIYKQDPEAVSIKLENLNDPQTLNQINAKFFAKNPLDFQRL